MRPQWLPVKKIKTKFKKYKFKDSRSFTPTISNVAKPTIKFTSLSLKKFEYIQQFFVFFYKPITLGLESPNNGLSGESAEYKRDGIV